MREYSVRGSSLRNWVALNNLGMRGHDAQDGQGVLKDEVRVKGRGSIHMLQNDPRLVGHELPVGRFKDVSVHAYATLRLFFTTLISYASLSQ